MFICTFMYVHMYNKNNCMSVHLIRRLYVPKGKMLCIFVNDDNQNHKYTQIEGEREKNTGTDNVF